MNNPEHAVQMSDLNYGSQFEKIIIHNIFIRLLIMRRSISLIYEKIKR